MENAITASTGFRNQKLTLASVLLSASMLATGSCGLVAEYILSTVSSYILGNSIEQFSVVIALMMLMMGLANYLQKFLSNEGLIEKFIITEIIIAVLGGFAPIALFAAFGFMENNFSLVLYSLASAIGFLIGLEIPLVMRINEKYSENLPINLSRVISFDYFGSFIGAMAWVYMLRKLPLIEISFIIAGINFFVAVVTFFYFVKIGLVKKQWLISVAICLTSVCLLVGYWKNTSWEIGLEQRLYEEKIVFSQTTKYQRMVMTYDKAANDYRLYLNGNLQLSSKDEHVYHELLVHPALAMHRNPERVLILGGGDGMALREVLKHKSVKAVTLVDLDAGMTDFCSTNKIFRELNQDSFRDARLKVLKSGAIYSTGTRPVFQETKDGDYGAIKQGEHFVQKVAQVDIFNVDASNFIKEVKDIWDVVIIDFPDPNSIELAKLYSKEFYMQLQNVLAENGLFVIQATSPYHAKEAYLCIKRTIESTGFETIPYHENVPSFGDWGWFLGWKNKTYSKSDMLTRIKTAETNIETKYFSAETFQRAATFGKKDLISEFDDVSTLMRPVLLDRYLRYSWIID
jgi:spermidine synthase